MYFIQQWNHPEFIYLLIPLTICMLSCTYSYFWIRLRAVHVNNELNPGAPKIRLKFFYIRLAVIELAILALSIAFLFFIPKIIPLFSFFLSLLFSSALCLAAIVYLKWYIRKTSLIPEIVEQNTLNWRGGTQAKFRIVRPTLFILSMAFMILAMMDPEGTEKTTKLRRTPLNVTILLDLSKSMDAADLSPSRLTVAKDEISKLLEQGTGDEIGLVYFTDTAVIQAPQTLDTQSLRAYLNVVSTDSMPSHGTDLSLALETALRTFNPSVDLDYKESGHATRRVVLVTDGESHTGDIQTTLQQYVNRKIHIDVIAIGTENGAEIPDKNGKPIKYDNNTVISKVQTELLQKIASTTDGVYVPYLVPDVAALSILSHWDVVRISSKPKGLASSLYRTQFYQVFLYPAYLLLILFIIHPLLVVLCKPLFEYIRRRKEMHSERSRTASPNKLEE